ncbi:hypothetical protein B296_00025462 [Ensete ventricosum]|uniref:Citrate synthase n=1 Tax=Ensete ventricosum TaxID=4639 RepID=A0A427ATB1_ENSVE|nr:hypothetical protein B296_00025462 [Ensete ventricosum]
MESRSDPSALARGRLAVLSAHLAANRSFGGFSSVLERSATLSQEDARPPGNLGGSLTVIDERTGKKYALPVSAEGTVKATDLKKVHDFSLFGFDFITAGKNDKGLKIYDPGYLNTAPVRSSICFIDGDEGILRYRGYPIEELAENSTFLEVAYLLISVPNPIVFQCTGIYLPKVNWKTGSLQYLSILLCRRASWLVFVINDIIQAMPHDAHPMGVLVSALSTLSVFHPDANPALRVIKTNNCIYLDISLLCRVKIFITQSKLETSKLCEYLERYVLICTNNCSCSLFTVSRKASRSSFQQAVIFREFLIYAGLFVSLVSSLKFEVFASQVCCFVCSGVDVFTALAGAVGALYGPLHGGANEVYTGVWLRHYTPVRERLVSEATDRLGQVAVSNASKRRLAGSRAGQSNMPNELSMSGDQMEPVCEDRAKRRQSSSKVALSQTRRTPENELLTGAVGEGKMRGKEAGGISETFILH